jgi:signal transduction histidine kinase
MSLSVTWRARLLSGLLTALALIALVFLAQSRIRTVLYDAVDTALREQAEGLLRDPRFVQGPRLPLPGGLPPRRGILAPLRFGTTTLLRPRHIPLNPPDGAPEPPPPWSAAGLEAAKTAGDDLRDELAPDGTLRRTYSVRSNGFVLQTASQLDGTQAALREIQGALYGLLLPLALISFLLGALLTEVVLAPVRRIARAAASLAPDNLSARLPAPGGGDAFDRLVGTLNALLVRLDDAFARQKRFTADASHELRTPLAVVKATTSFLLESEELTESQRRMVTRADATADRANRLVSDLLLLARTEGGALAVHPEQVRLAPLLAEVADDAKAAWGGPCAETILEVPDSAQLTTDPDLLRRLVGNLLSNALRHTPVSGQVTVRWESGMLTVSDTGEGIPKEALLRLGEPFFRPDDARARSHGGAGLGLAICKEIGGALGANLDIQSKPGQGTRVMIGFPHSMLR